MLRYGLDSNGTRQEEMVVFAEHDNPQTRQKLGIFNQLFKKYLVHKFN
jgi:hypothetical protein